MRTQERPFRAQNQQVQSFQPISAPEIRPLWRFLQLGEAPVSRSSYDNSLLFKRKANFIFEGNQWECWGIDQHDTSAMTNYHLEIPWHWTWTEKSYLSFFHIILACRKAIPIIVTFNNGKMLRWWKEWIWRRHSFECISKLDRRNRLFMGS